MPVTKHSFAHYQVIDACICNKQWSYPGIDHLIERCSKRLDQRISRSAIDKDLKAMKDDPEPGYYAPIRYDRQKCGYYFENPEYSICNIQLAEEDIDAIDRILDVIDVRLILSMEEYVQFENPLSLC